MRVEQGLREKLLYLLAKRGTMGLKKTQFFEILQGIHYDELEREMGRLEREGLVAVTWSGPADFTATITAKGIEESRRGGPQMDYG